MKSKEIEKIRELNDTELQNRLKDLKTELFNLRFQHAINQLDNPMRLKAVKKEIADHQRRLCARTRSRTAPRRNGRRELT